MFSYNLCALKYEEIKCKKTAKDFIKSGRVKESRPIKKIKEMYSITTISLLHFYVSNDFYS